MPRLTVAQRTWVCNEFARVGNAHEVLKKWRNHWQNMKRKTQKDKKLCFCHSFCLLYSVIVKRNLLAVFNDFLKF